MTDHSLPRFLADVTSWAEKHAEIVALALIGSHARDAARPDSDVDVFILCTSPKALVDDRDWVRQFGEVQTMGVEVYGPTRSLRVFYRDGLEVEFGIADPAWASFPLDSGTQRVLTDGVRILYDPVGKLSEAVNATLAESP